MNATFLQMSLDASRSDIRGNARLDVPSYWLQETELMQMRLTEFLDDPPYAAWGLHAIRIASSNQMIGHVGFHSLPDAEYLHPYWPDAVELAYTTYPPYRRQGYAAEAVTGLLRWAASSALIRRFLLTVSACNVASRRLAEKLGFRVVERYRNDECLGEDLLYVLQGKRLEELVSA
jgi:RimJ/RimL family protein N-acetyltransferase